MAYSLDRFLKIRPRSEKEIRDKLRFKKFKDHEIDREISKLKKIDLINDKRFAGFWIEYLTEFKIRGKRFIEYELKRKGIEKELYENLMPDYESERQNAKKLIEQKFGSHIPNDYKSQGKIISYLSRYGFSIDIAKEAINNIE